MQPGFPAAEYGWLNGVALHFLAPLYGVPSGLYALHHRVMHHVEGNAAHADLSSTEPYQRDCALHFLWCAAAGILPALAPCSVQGAARRRRHDGRHASLDATADRPPSWLRRYWLRHGVGAWVELLVYALRRRRYRLFAESLLAEGLYLGALRALWLWRPAATLWVFLIPYAITSLALMFGNWCAGRSSPHWIPSSPPNSAGACCTPRCSNPMATATGCRQA